MVETPRSGNKARKNARKRATQYFKHVPLHGLRTREIEWTPPHVMRSDEDFQEQLESLWDCE